jgi:hydroxymethylpyrimidine pyrophosphatase-like HAD family hydrolase
MFNIHLLTFLTTVETGNMSFKLAVFDVDGTLAGIHQPTNLEVSKKLRNLEKLGAKIVLASRKNVSYLLGFARGIGARPVFVIAESGFLVFYVKKAELKKMVEMTPRNDDN